MEEDLKNKVKSDLEYFLKGKQYYHHLGRVWRRSFLLYSPLGTGKLSFVAAMANFLSYDVYDMPGKNAGVGCHFLLEGIFLTQGLNNSRSPALAGRFFTTGATWEAHFPQSLQQFTFPLTVTQDYLFSTASPTFAVTCLFDNTRSNRCEVIPNCSFYVHSLDD